MNDDYGFSQLFLVFQGGMAFTTVIWLALFFVKAIAINKIAKYRGMSMTWLAFIPFVSNFLIGSIADDINARIQKKTHLKIFYLLIAALSILGTVLSVKGYESFFSVAFVNDMLMDTGITSMFASFMGTMAIVGIISVISLIVTIIVNYRIFVDYAPQNAVLFVVLSAIFFITEPFLFQSIVRKPSISIQQQQQFQQPLAQPIPHTYNDQQMNNQP